MGKKPTRILFVPFRLTGKVDVPGYQYASKNNAWIEHVQKKAVLEDDGVYDLYQLFYSGTMSPLLASLKTDDQVYIRGHCLPGFTGIFDHATKDEAGVDMRPSNADPNLLIKLSPNPIGRKDPLFSLSASEVVARLKESGLNAGFDGAIKCYNCHSGEAGEGETSFAQAVRQALNDSGITKCKVYGYKGKLSSTYDSATGHKTSTAGGRASENRVLIG